jgi:hypothetical protein
MKTFFCWLLILAALESGSVLAATPVPDIEVLQFEGVAPPGMGSPAFTGFFQEGSYQIYNPYGQWVDSMTEDVGTEHPDNGTDWFLVNNINGMVISHARSQPFHLLSLDLTEYSYVFSGERPIHIDGFTSSGTRLSTTFITPARPVGQVPRFQQFTLPQQWSEMWLRSVTITQPNNGFALDNIRLMAVVPEPMTALLLSSAGFASIFCRRQRAL